MDSSNGNHRHAAEKKSIESALSDLFREAENGRFFITNLHVANQKNVYCLSVSREAIALSRKDGEKKNSAVWRFAEKALFVGEKKADAPFLKNFMATLRGILSDVLQNRASLIKESAHDGSNI